MFFSVDGIPWNFGCTIERIAELKSSEISGMLLNRSYYHDVLGTYLSYNIRIEVPRGQEKQYFSFYEAITKPVGTHSFVVPYNDKEITINGRVANIKDIYRKLPSGQVKWHGIAFTIISNTPIKKMSLGEVVASSGFVIPPDTEFTVGGIYLFTANGFQKIN